MYFRAIAGIVAGLSAGVVSGIMFLLMKVPEIDGLAYNVLQVIARAVGSNDPAVGWSYHLFNSAIIGLIFGIVVGRVVNRLTTAMGYGLIAAVTSWILANIVLLPRLTDLSTYAADGTVTHPLLSPFGIATAIGYIVEGVLLGVIFLWVYNPIRLYDFREERRAEQQESPSRDDTLRPA